MKIKIIITLIICLNLSSCFVGKIIETSKAKTEFTVENDAIPPEFGENKEMIIIGILRGRRSYDKYLKSAFKNYYNGKYILISAEEMRNSKYNDKKKYRYIFDYSDGSTITYTFSSGRKASSNNFRHFIFDRLNNKRYQSGAEFTFFAKSMKVYMANLEQKRISN